MKNTLDKTKKTFLESRKPRLIPALLVALSIPFMIFIVSPLEIYKNGIDEFNFALSDFIFILLLAFILVSIINFCLLFFLPKTAFRVLYALFLATLLMLFLQINFLNIGLNSLNGDEIAGTNVSTSKIVVNTVVWVIVETLFVVGFFVFKKRDIKALICIMLSFALLASQLINFFIVAIPNGKGYKTVYERLLEEDENYKPTFLTTKNLTTVSNNKNVIVFCIDRFDGLEYAEKAMKDFPEYFKDLDGFTYYDDNISMYPSTYPSICYMLTNIERDFDKSRKDYLNDAYRENQTLKKLHEENYSVNIYTDPFYAYFNAFYFPDYIDNKKETTMENVSSSVSFLDKCILALRFFQISMYRATPFIIKDYCGNVSSSTCNDSIKLSAKDLGDYPEASTDMKATFDAFDKKDFTLNTEKNHFAFIHVSGCHNVTYDENWNSARSSHNDYKHIAVSIKNSIKIINTYIEKMKVLNGGSIYKNATIIITGDHAHGNAYDLIEEPNLTALFIKPSGVDAGNPIDNEFCHKPVSHEDLWKTIFDSEGIISFDSSINGVSMLNEIPTNRERHFYFNTWNLAQTNFTIYNFKINGSGRDFKNWNTDITKAKEINRNYYE